MSKRFRRLWFLGSFFVAGALAPLLMRADRAERERLEANYQAIAEMTRPERLRLERNFRDFLEMSPADQDRYRNLHAQLELDRTRTGLHAEVMETYYAWLSTLRSDQRADLRKETDPQQRRVLVEQIIDQQQAPPPDTFPGGGSSAPRFLTSRQLDDLFAAIEPHLHLTPEQTESLAGLDGLRYRLKLIGFLYSRYQRPLDDDRFLLRTVIQRLSEQQLLPHMIQALTDNELRGQIQAQPDGGIQFFTGILFWSIGLEASSYWADHPPNEANLRETFQKLSEDEQEELLALGVEDFQRRLINLFIERQLEELDIHPALRQMLRGFRQPRNRRWGGGGFQGTRGGGGGDRSNFGGQGQGVPPGDGPPRGQGGPGGPGNGPPQGEDDSGRRGPGRPPVE